MPPKNARSGWGRAGACIRSTRTRPRPKGTKPKCWRPSARCATPCFGICRPCSGAGPRRGGQASPAAPRRRAAPGPAPAGSAAAPAGRSAGRLAGLSAPVAGSAAAGGHPGLPGPALAGGAADRAASAGRGGRVAVPLLPGRRAAAPVLQPQAGPGHGPGLPAGPVPPAARHGAAVAVRRGPGAPAAGPGRPGLRSGPGLRAAVRGDRRAAPARGGAVRAPGRLCRGGRRAGARRTGVPGQLPAAAGSGAGQPARLPAPPPGAAAGVQRHCLPPPLAAPSAAPLGLLQGRDVFLFIAESYGYTLYSEPEHFALAEPFLRRIESRLAAAGYPDRLQLPGLAGFRRQLLAGRLHPGRGRAHPRPDGLRGAAGLAGQAHGRLVQRGGLPDRELHARHHHELAGGRLLPFPAQVLLPGLRLPGAQPEMGAHDRPVRGRRGPPAGGGPGARSRSSCST